MTGDRDLHRLEILSLHQWAKRAASYLATAIADAIERRGRCLMAISGGTTPGSAFDQLATIPLDWDRVIVIQVDERLAPAGSEGRNLTRQRESFATLPVTWLPLPVDDLLAVSAAENLTVEDAAPFIAEFTDRLTILADDPPVLDIVQLGLGDDGHTASLFPDDPALIDLVHYTALTGCQQGYRRLTLTRPVLDRARLAVWLVRGAAKAKPLGGLLAGDLTMPAGLIMPRQSVIMADTEAARQV
jgi:6-phosphogluconolactonase